MALKVFCQCRLVQAHTLQRIVHPHALQLGGPFFAEAAAFFLYWTAWIFFYLCHMDAAITLTPTTISHSWLVWLSFCPGWDELPGLSQEPGWPPSPSPPARSYRFTVVKLLFKAARLCPPLATRVITGHTPNKNFLCGRLRRRASLSSCQWRKTGPQLAFSVLGTIDVTGHCAIEDRPPRRALSRRAGKEDRRRFFLQTSLWGKTSRWWNFHFWVYLPFKGPLELSFWSSLTFLHHGIENVEGHLV